MNMAEDGKTIINVTVQAGAEYVQNKYVQNEIGKVENGGIGVMVNQRVQEADNGTKTSAEANPRTKQGDFKMVSEVFTYKWTKQHPERVTAFYQMLVKLRAIEKDTNHEEFEKLFTGVPTDLIVKWLAPKSALKFLMSTLKERNYIGPAGKIWVITQSHFKDTQDRLFTDLNKEHNPKKLENLISCIADTLDPQKSVQKIDMQDDDIAQALWSGIRQKI